MKTHIRWLALPAIATAIAFAPPASAAVVTYTYTGYVAEGTDQIGLFGGGNLTGADFTAVFSRDDALADDISLGEVNSYVRGAQAVTGKLTIGGVTIDIGGVNGEQSQFDNGAFEGFFHHAAGVLGGLSFTASTMADPTDYLAGPDYHTLGPLTADNTPGFFWQGRFDFGAADPQDPNQGLFTNGRFVPYAVAVSSTGAVPEPATWAMMIMGFGGVGWTLRRRRGALQLCAMDALRPAP